MDQAADLIAQDIKDIVQTRIAIAEKLGAIEQHVGSTLQHARTTMTQVADKTTSSVHETLKATKEAFDPLVHVTRHPWMFVGGTLFLGYAVGALYRRGWRIDGVVPYYPRGAKGAAVMPTSGSPSPNSKIREYIPSTLIAKRTMLVRNKAGPIDPHYGLSWNESSKTNLGWYGAASSDSGEVSSTRCSAKPYRPSCR